MKVKTLKRGEILFRQGDPGDCLYDVYTGRVGVYSKYRTPEEKLLKEYYPDQYFGEMGLLDQAPRSATAVALENDTSVGVVTEESFGEFFEKNPARVLMIMQQLSSNLRRRTKEYMEVCKEIQELAGKEAQK